MLPPRAPNLMGTEDRSVARAVRSEGVQRASQTGHGTEALMGGEWPHSCGRPCAETTGGG